MVRAGLQFRYRRWLEGAAQDARFAIRMLGRKPAFSAIVIAVLALGIGLNAAMFSIVQSAILRPLPYRDAERLTVTWQSSPQHRSTGEWFNAYRDFEEWQKRSRSLSQVAAMTWATDGYAVRRNGRLQSALVIPVSVNFFSLLGVGTRYGRVFEARDAESGCTVVASYGYWRDHLGADRDLATMGLTVDDRPCQVVGVMPEGFSFYPRATQLWMVIPQNGEFAQKPWQHPVGVVGRLRPGVSRAASEQELTAIQASIEGERPQSSAEPSAPVVLDMQQEFMWLTGRNLREGLWLLSGAVALVLVIGCVNVANLLLGRAAERQREMAIRASIGCGRARMMRQMLTESLVLSLCGAVLGAALASVVLHLFRAMNPVELPPGNVVEMRWPVLAVLLALSVMCTLLCGSAPAWQAWRTDFTAALKSDARSGAAVRQRTGKVLVVLQVALSLMLLSGAVLLATSLARLTRTPLGFRTDHLLMAEMRFAMRPKTNEAAEQRTNEAILARLAALPGVENAAFVSHILPLGSDVLAVSGKVFDMRTATHDVASQTVSAGYFQAAGIAVLAGRGFSNEDRKDTDPVAIINERLAREYFPDGDAIGRKIKLGRPEDKDGPWLTVAGIVGNVKTTTVFQEMGYISPPVVYRPMLQVPGAVRTLLLRTAGEPLSVSRNVEEAVASVDRDAAVSNMQTMQMYLHEQSGQPRFRTVLLGGFAGMALLLAALGIYGLLAHQVRQRTLEIGIRMALGANRQQIVRRVARQALGLTGLGIVLGIAGSLAGGRLMAGLLYETRASDPWILAAATAVFLCVSAGASVLPAWRASHVEPMVAMRAE